MTSNLLELQEMLRNLDMGSVQKVAQGQSGKAAQLLGMDEIKRRGEQMQEAKAEEAEQGMQQPPMVDQFLAASQQMMGQPAPMPPQMAQAMPPQQQGIGSIMPQAPMQQPKMPPQMPMGQPPQQMPPRMMAGGGQVGTDLMRKPDMSNFGIVEYLMSQGMSREEAEAQARSATGGSQPLNVGGFIQKYQDGGSVLGGDEYGAVTDEEIEALEREQPGLIDNAIEWAKENPLEAAEYGLMGLLTIGTIPVSGIVAGAGVGAAALGRKLALKQLGKRAIGLIKNLKPSARATRTVNRRQPSRTPNSLQDMADIRAGMINKEAASVGRRYAAAGGLGAMTAGNILGGGDEEEVAATPEGDYPDPVGPSLPNFQGPLMPLVTGPQGGSGEELKKDSPEDAPWYKDPKLSNVFQFMTRAGLGLAAGEGDNLGQDIAQASISGMDYLTEMKNMEREQGRLDAAQSLRESADVRDQERLEIQRDLTASQIRRNDQSGVSRGSLNDNQAAVSIDEYLSRAGKMPGDPDYENMRAQLMQIFKAYGTEGLFQAFAEGRRDESAELQAMVFG